MASNKRVISTSAKVGAASGITAAQKAAVQKVLDIIDSYPNGGAGNYDLTRIYDILDAAF
jgi:hypothetical protein